MTDSTITRTKLNCIIWYYIRCFFFILYLTITYIQLSCVQACSVLSTGSDGRNLLTSAVIWRQCRTGHVGWTYFQHLKPEYLASIGVWRRISMQRKNQQWQKCCEVTVGQSCLVFEMWRRADNRQRTMNDRRQQSIWPGRRQGNNFKVRLIVERPALAVRLDLSFRSVYFFSPGISSQPLNLSQQKFARWRQVVRNRTWRVSFFDFLTGVRLGAKNVTFCPDLPGVTFTKYNMAPKRRTILWRLCRR